jgi:hypothetical protein
LNESTVYHRVVISASSLLNPIAARAGGSVVVDSVLGDQRGQQAFGGAAADFEVGFEIAAKEGSVVGGEVVAFGVCGDDGIRTTSLVELLGEALATNVTMVATSVLCGVGAEDLPRIASSGGLVGESQADLSAVLRRPALPSKEAPATSSGVQEAGRPADRDAEE